MPTVNFHTSGSKLTVTIDGEQLPIYSLLVRNPTYAVQPDGKMQFIFPDGRYIYNLPKTSVQFEGVAFNPSTDNMTDKLEYQFTPEGRPVGTVATPTWQATLDETAGSELDRDNTVLNQHTLSFILDDLDNQNNAIRFSGHPTTQGARTLDIRFYDAETNNGTAGGMFASVLNSGLFVDMGLVVIPANGTNNMEVSVNGSTVKLSTGDNANKKEIVITPTAATLQSKVGGVQGAAKKIAAISTADNFANDAAAATGGIAIGELYHTSGAVKVRLA